MANIALISGGVVRAVIVADLAFAQTLGYESVVNVAGVSPMPGPGWTWTGGSAFTAPAAAGPAQGAPAPVLVLTDISVDNAHAGSSTIKPTLDDVTCPVGTTLTFSAELRNIGGQLLPVNDMFRMPVRSRAGQEMVLAVVMADGRTTVSVTMDQSGAWSVTDDTINQDLPPDRRMRFSGVRVFVTANA